MLEKLLLATGKEIEFRSKNFMRTKQTDLLLGRQWSTVSLKKISEALLLWFSQLQEKERVISGPILKSEALDFYKIFFDNESFTASAGCLYH